MYAGNQNHVPNHASIEFMSKSTLAVVDSTKMTQSGNTRAVYEPKFMDKSKGNV